MVDLFGYFRLLRLDILILLAPYFSCDCIPGYTSKYIKNYPISFSWCAVVNMCFFDNLDTIVAVIIPALNIMR